MRGLSQQLGLAIAPVRSTLHRGTRFRVLVPGALRCVPGPSPRPACEVASDSERPLEGLLLAVLDNEDDARHDLMAALNSAGALCVGASATTELVDKLDREPRYPDALICELDLSGTADGIQVVRQLRAAWQTQTPAFILARRPDTSIDMPAACLLLNKSTAAKQLVEVLTTRNPFLPQEQHTN